MFYSGTDHTAFFVVVVLVAVPIPDIEDIAARIQHVDGNVVVVYAHRFGIYAGKCVAR